MLLFTAKTAALVGIWSLQSAFLISGFVPSFKHHGQAIRPLKRSKEEVISLDVDTSTAAQLRDELLDLIPRLSSDEDFRTVEQLVNSLEARYQPVQTLEFFNFAMQGDWKLLFSTQLGAQNPVKFRLRQMYQRIESDGMQGKVMNQCTWDVSEDDKWMSGTLTAKCEYRIQQGSRMALTIEDHILQPATDIPQDIPTLVSLLHRSMRQLFDPSSHSVDTTYLDDRLRIVRYTGPRYEGVRDIFLRL